MNNVVIHYSSGNFLPNKTKYDYILQIGCLHLSIEISGLIGGQTMVVKKYDKALWLLDDRDHGRSQAKSIRCKIAGPRVKKRIQTYFGSISQAW